MSLKQLRAILRAYPEMTLADLEQLRRVFPLLLIGTRGKA
jgi:hypothetical protein